MWPISPHVKLANNNMSTKLITSHTKTLCMLLGAVLLLPGVTSCGKSQTPQALVAEARQYQQKGDFPAAIIQLKNALQKNPDDAEARLLLGTIYNEAGDPPSAEKELRRAQDLRMSPAKVLPQLGQTLLVQGKFEQVLDETKQFAGAQAPAEILSLRGNAYLALRKTKEAKAAFEQALQNQPGSPEALIGLAKHALTEGNIDAASSLSEQAVSKNPKSAPAWLFKANLLRAQGKIEASLAAYDQTLKLQSNNVSARINRAFLNIGKRKFDVAKADIDAARKVSPKGLMVFYSQALLDFRQNNHAAAWESLQQILRAAPQHLPSVLLAGAVQYSLGSMPQAEQYLKNYLEQDPRNLYARKLLVSTLLRTRQPQRALDVLAPALKAAQSDVQVLTLAGESYIQLNDFTKAEEYFEKASALSPTDARLHAALGISKLAQGEDALAIADLETAAALDNKTSKVDVLLVMTHLRHKEFDKALKAATTLEKEQPASPLSHNLKGVAYLGKKSFAQARASFEKALAIQPTFFPAAANLAQLDLQDKKPDEAKKRFETLLAKDKKNIKAMTALANLALARGQKNEATTWLERASSENPDALQPAIQLVAHYLRIGEKQKALILAQKIQGSNPSSPEVLDILAQAQFVNGDKPAALASYNRLAAMRPDSALAQLRIASIHMAMSSPSQASAALKKALALQPDFLDAQLAMASLESRMGNHEQALAIARQIQDKQGKLPTGFVLEGDLLMAQKKPELAVKAYEQAFALRKSGPLAVKLHASLSRAGNSQEAAARLTQWLQQHPTDAATRMYLAGTYVAEQQHKAAVEQYQIILRQYPQYVPALNNLAGLYQLEKNPRALEYAEQAFKLSPDSPAVQDTLGWILVERGNTSRGLPLLQKATNLAPEVAVIRFHLAQGLAKSGDKVRARKELERLLASGKNFAQINEARELLKQL